MLKVQNNLSRPPYVGGVWVLAVLTRARILLAVLLFYLNCETNLLSVQFKVLHVAFKRVHNRERSRYECTTIHTSDP